MKITDFERKLVEVIPSDRQLNHQKLEFYGFVHFTVNTFTDKEWGDGTESPSIFDPKEFDAEQWAKALSLAGMKGAVLTCKHHDGFCLWPSRFTDHTIAASPFKGGKGDIVYEVSQAFKKYDLKFGIYLSPWDRNHPSYGKGKEYDDYFDNQLTELLTLYGDVFCVWLDGACGEGSNGRIQTYDWERYYEVIRKYQPGACISVCGPDVRWCGNEAGDTREEEWSVVPERLKDKERIKENSQKSDDAAFRQRKIAGNDQDLGSRRVLEGETDLAWYPAEVNLSIRPGWFYHKSEDDKIRSLENLVSIYDHSVGGNAMMLLNIPPMPNGLFHENDVNRLKELGEYIKKREACNLVDKAVISSSGSEPGCEIENVRKADGTGYFKTPDGIRSCKIELSWADPVVISMVVIKEEIRLSQRIEKFLIMNGDTNQVIYTGKTVGYRKNAVFPEIKTRNLRIEILESRVAPAVSFLGVY
mgnify:CR=1 FL=1|jgi:alpha-L-fucosidase